MLYVVIAFLAFIAAWVLGGLVFFTAHLEEIPLLQWVFCNFRGLTAVILATLSLILLWYLLLRGKTRVLLILAGFQVCMVLFAVSYAHFPDLVIMKGGQALSLLEHYSAPAVRWLG